MYLTDTQRAHWQLLQLWHSLATTTDIVNLDFMLALLIYYAHPLSVPNVATGSTRLNLATKWSR